MTQHLDAVQAARVYNRTYVRWVRICAAEGVALNESLLVVVNALAKQHVGRISKARAQRTAAKTLIGACVRCSGTGMFITGSVNGKPVGPGGICFTCQGKGVMSVRDTQRNWGYWNFYARVSA